MKKILLLLALVFIIGCQEDFKTTFDRFEDISKEYDTSFFTERLNGSEVGLNKIQPLINEIEAVKVEENVSVRFKEARINMLKSQLYWQLAMDIGLVGRADDGFRCSEKQHLDKAGDYYNKTHYYGLKAYNELDLLLRDFPEHWDTIGIRENRTFFYDSPIFWAGERARYNRELYIEICTGKLNPNELPMMNSSKDL